MVQIGMARMAGPTSGVGTDITAMPTINNTANTACAVPTMERLDVPPPPAGMPGPLSRPTPAAIGGLLKGGGFSNVAVEQDEVTFAFDSPEHFTAYIRAISAPIRAMIEQHAGEAQEEAWDAITQAAADAGGGSKPLSFSNVVLLASATA